MPWIIHDHRLVFVEDSHLFSHRDDAIRQVLTQLSPPAMAVLSHAPPSFCDGRIVTLTVLADFAGYIGPGYIHKAVRELVRYGFVVAHPVGKRKHHYAGVPMFMHSSPVKALREGQKRAA
jgi:hypothetical protein